MPPRQPRNEQPSPPAGDGDKPPVPPGPPAPPNGNTPDSPAPGDDGKAQFRAILVEFFQADVLPNLRRYFDEQLEAKLDAVRTQTRVAVQVDAQAMVQQTVAALGPKISQEVQAIANELTARVGQVERKADQALQAAQPPGGIAARKPTGAEVGQGPTSGPLGKAEGWLVVAKTVVDYGVEKIWPLVQQNQMMKAMGEYGGLVPLFQHIHDTNPVMAQIGANIMAPDQLTNMMAMTIPNIAANAMAQGMRARSLAQALAANPGGAGWPGIPLPSSPGLSPTPGGMLDRTTPRPSDPSGGARMAQRPRPKYKLRPSRDSREPESKPEPGASVQASERGVVRRLADLA